VSSPYIYRAHLTAMQPETPVQYLRILALA
jgi:hypothetical protein